LVSAALGPGLLRTMSVDFPRGDEVGRIGESRTEQGSARNDKFEEMERELREAPIEETLVCRVPPNSLMGNIRWQHFRPMLAEANVHLEMDEALAHTMQLEADEQVAIFVGGDAGLLQHSMGHQDASSHDAVGVVDQDFALAVALAEHEDIDTDVGCKYKYDARSDFADGEMLGILQMEGDTQRVRHSGASDPRWLGGDVRPSVAGDADLARRLQIDADTEAAWQIVSPDRREHPSEVLPSVAGDGDIAWTLQVEADAEAARNIVASDGLHLHGVAGDGEMARRLQMEADAEAVRFVGLGHPQRQNYQHAGQTTRTNGPRQMHERPDARDLASDPHHAMQVLGMNRHGPSVRGSRGRGRSEDSPSGSEWEELEQGFAVPGANSNQVASTTATISFHEVEAGREQCNICCENYARGEELRVLPCMHRFHATCVDRWLAQSRTCPICKHDIAG